MTQEKTKSGFEFWFHKGSAACLMHLHGIAEYTSMDKALLFGPGQYIRDGWSPEFSVVIPKNISEAYFTTEQINETFEAVIALGCNANKLGLSGYSNGGGSALNYADDSQAFKMNMLVLTAPYLKFAPKYSNINMPTFVYCAVNDGLYGTAKSVVAGIEAADKCPELKYQWEGGGGHTGIPKYVYSPGDYKGIYKRFTELCAGEPIEPPVESPKEWSIKNAETGQYFKTGIKDSEYFRFS